MTAAERRGPRARTVAAAALLFVLVRLITLATTDPVAMHRIDELYAGAAAGELAQGRGLPLARLSWGEYASGSIVTVLVTVATRAVLGPGLLSIKATALLFSTATFVVWMLVVARLFGGRAARFYALLAVLAPPEAAKLELIAWGIHQETALPIATALLALAALFATGDGMLDAEVAARPVARGGLWSWFALGLAAAASLFFSWLALIHLTAIAVVLALLGRRALTGRRAAALGAGVLLGIAPTVWFNAAWGLAGLRTLAPAITGASGSAGAALATAVSRAVDLVTVHVPRFLAPHVFTRGAEPAPAPVYRALEALPAIALLAAMLLAATSVSRLRARGRVAAECVLLLPLLLFAVAFAFSSFFVAPESTGVIAYRYLGPMVPFALAVMAVAATRLPHGAGAVAVTLLALGPLAHHALALPAASTSFARKSGASYLAYGWRVYEVEGRALGPTLARLEEIPDAHLRAAAVEGVAMAHGTYTWFHEDGSPEERATRFERTFPGMGYWRDVFVSRLARILEVEGRLSLDRDGFGRFIAFLGERATLDPLAAPAMLALGRTEGPDAARDADCGRLPIRSNCDDGRGQLQAHDSPAPVAPVMGGYEYRRGMGRVLAREALAATTNEWGGRGPRAAARTGAARLRRPGERGARLPRWCPRGARPGRERGPGRSRRARGPRRAGPLPRPPRFRRRAGRCTIEGS